MERAQQILQLQLSAENANARAQRLQAEVEGIFLSFFFSYRFLSFFFSYRFLSFFFLTGIFLFFFLTGIFLFFFLTGFLLSFFLTGIFLFFFLTGFFLSYTKEMRKHLEEVEATRVKHNWKLPEELPNMCEATTQTLANDDGLWHAQDGMDLEIRVSPLLASVPFLFPHVDESPRNCLVFNIVRACTFLAISRIDLENRLLAICGKKHFDGLFSRGVRGEGGGLGWGGIIQFSG
jgi:hypothetical protein